MSSRLMAYGVLRDRQTTNVERWVTFAVLFYFGFTASCNLFKPSPVMPVIGAQFGVDAGSLGLVMTCYSIAAVVFAPIGALVMRKVGVKFMVVVSCAIMVLGTIVASIAQSWGLFLFGRIVEGVAYGLICVEGPNILPRLFPRRQMGLAVGIWSQWIPCGTIIAFFASPLVYQATGNWQGVWYVTVVMGLVALILLLLFVKMPAKDENTIVDGDAAIDAKPGKQYFRSALAVCLIFGIWVYLYVVNINGFYPTFLQEVKGMDVFSSSMLPNWLAIITIPLGILAGVLSDKFAIRKKCLVVFYVVVALLFWFVAFTPGEETMCPWAFCIIMGICASVIPTYTRGITPLLTTDSFKTDMALMCMALVTGLAQVFAFVATSSIAAIGWFANSQYVLAPLALLAAVVVFFLVEDDSKVVKVRVEEERADRENSEA